MPDRLRAYRYELRLRPAQAQRLSRWAGGLRWVWNAALAEQRRRHAAGERYAGYAEISAPVRVALGIAPVARRQSAPCRGGGGRAAAR